MGVGFMRKVGILILYIVTIMSLIAGCTNVQIEIPDEVFDGMIMVDDKIYTYTGYEVPVEIDRGAILGKISSTVKEYEMPMGNGQANFEIKGARFAQYEDDMVVFLNNKWVLFKNQEDMISGFSVNNFGFLMEDFSHEEIYKVFRTIRKYIIVDDNYEANLDSIIETSFRECGIDDQSIIEDAKSNLEITVSPPKPTISPQAFKLNQLSGRGYTIQGENLSEADDEFIIHFGQSFVNLFNGAVGEQLDVKFEKYISNPNLLKFADKMLELTQKQDLLGRNSVNYGWNNEFKKVKIERINDNLFNLELPYQFEGSGNSCKMLVSSEDKTLKIIDFYFGSKDGIDTITTGHPADRKLDNPNLWNDWEWVRGVFSKLEELEEELNSSLNKNGR